MVSVDRLTMISRRVCVRLVVFSAIVFSFSESASSLARVRNQISQIKLNLKREVPSKQFKEYEILCKSNRKRLLNMLQN